MVMQLNTQPGAALAQDADPRYIQRVRYREGQRLRLADLRSEQSYRIATRRRHNLAAHDWGVVYGLALERISGGVAVRPGFAVDGYGRELIIAHTVILDEADLLNCLGPARPEDNQIPKLDVWLVYRLTEPSGARRAERTDLLITPRDGQTEPNFLAPPGIPQSELDFAAHEIFDGDLPVRPWPVYLGYIQGERLDDRTIGIAEAYSQPRQHTSVCAGDVSSPDGRVRVTVGEQYPNDPRRFVVSMCDPDQPEQMIERVIVNKRGDLALRGNLAIESGAFNGDAQLIKDECGREVEGESRQLGLRLNPIPMPTVAQPWRMYTTTVTEGEGNDKRQYREFRIELYHPGKLGNPSDYRLQIGSWKGDRFTPAFTVVADGTVIAQGDVAADRFIQPPIGADLSDPRFQELLRNVSALLYTDQELQLTLSHPQVIRHGDSISIGVNVRNVSDTAQDAVPVAVGPIHFYEYIVFPLNVAPRRGPVPAIINQLNPGQSGAVSLPRLIAVRGRQTVAVVAYGPRATGGITIATATVSFNVLDAIS